MRTIRYRTDLTETQFEPIKSCLQIGRKSKWPLITILNAIFYVTGEGCKWRALPNDFGLPWETVYWYFYKWSADNTWQCINDYLVMLRHEESILRGIKKGQLTEMDLSNRAAPYNLPTTLAIDSQSIKNTATSGRFVGFDGGKKIKGRKRLIIVDSIGNLLAVRVLAANKHDGPAAWQWWEQELRDSALLKEVKVIKGDQHFGGVFKKGVEQSTNIKVAVRHDLTKEKKTPTGKLKLHKGRWVVERTFGWSDNDRRLSKDYERLPRHAEAFILISSIKRMAKNKINWN